MAFCHESYLLAKKSLLLGSWLLLIGIILPIYQIIYLFTPNNRSGSLPISKFFRKTFEHKKIKTILGANLAAMILLSSVGQNFLPVNVSAKKEVSILSEPKEIIITETTFRQPVGGYISQNYHWYHPGIDIAGNDNQIIYPIASGKVIAVKHEGFGYGNNILIAHDNNLISRYAHLSLIKVAQNDLVDKNTALGYVGSTGWATGPHLHLEVYQGGKSINPLTILPKDIKNL